MWRKMYLQLVLIAFLVTSGQFGGDVEIEKAGRRMKEVYEGIISNFTESFPLVVEDVKFTNPRLVGSAVIRFVSDMRHIQKKTANTIKFLRNTRGESRAKEGYMGIEEDLSKLNSETQKYLMFATSYKNQCVACIMIDDVRTLTISMLSHVKDLLVITLEMEEASDEEYLKRTGTALKIIIEVARDISKTISDLLSSIKRIP